MRIVTLGTHSSVFPVPVHKLGFVFFKQWIALFLSPPLLPASFSPRVCRVLPTVESKQRYTKKENTHSGYLVDFYLMPFFGKSHCLNILEMMNNER